MTKTDQDREAFEATFQHLNHNKIKDGSWPEVYVHPHVESIWHGWQAAKSHKRASADSYITRLEERCAAYKGLLEVGAAEIRHLKLRMQSLAEHLKLRVQSLTESDFDGVLHSARVRAEAAEARADALQAKVERLQKALQWVDDMRSKGCPTDISNHARAALQPQEPKP